MKRDRREKIWPIVAGYVGSLIGLGIAWFVGNVILVFETYSESNSGAGRTAESIYTSFIALLAAVVTYAFVRKLVERRAYIGAGNPDTDGAAANTPKP